MGQSEERSHQEVISKTIRRLRIQMLLLSFIVLLNAISLLFISTRIKTLENAFEKLLVFLMNAFM